jgi:hypothetical protein
MVDFSCISTRPTSGWSSKSGWNTPFRLRVVVAVAAFELAGCNANQTLTPASQEALSDIYPNYNPYDPTKYGQTSGYYAGSSGGR